jgi:hypothetical protein
MGYWEELAKEWKEKDKRNIDPKPKKYEKNDTASFWIILSILGGLAFAGYKGCQYLVEKKLYPTMDRAAYEVLCKDYKNIFKNVGDAISQKDEEKLKRLYEDYLTAYRSVSTLSGSESKPLSFEEFKKSQKTSSKIDYICDVLKTKK